MSLEDPNISILSAAERRRAEDEAFEAKTNPLTPDTDDLIEQGTKEFDAMREEVLVRGGNAGFLYTDDPDPLTAKKKAELAEAQHYAIVQKETYKHYIEDLAYFTERLAEGGLFDDEHWKEDISKGTRLYDAYIARNPEDITVEEHKKVAQVSVSLFIEAESDPAKRAEVLANPSARGLYFMGEAYYAEMLAANPELKNLSQEDKAAFKATIMENIANKFNEDPEAWVAKAESIRQQLGTDSATAGRFSDLTTAEQEQYLQTFHAFNEKVIETGFTTPEGATPEEVRISYAEQKEVIFQQFKKDNPNAAGLDRMQHFVTKENALARDELYVYATSDWANELVAATMANIGEEDMKGGGHFTGGVGDIERIVIMQDVTALTMNKFLDSLPEDQQPTEKQRAEAIDRIKNDPAYKEKIVEDFSKQYAETKQKELTDIMERLNGSPDIPANLSFYSTIPQKQLDGFFAKGRENLDAADIAKIYDHLSDEEFEQAFGESRGDFFSKFAGNEVYQRVVTDRLYSTKKEYSESATKDPELRQQLESKRQQQEQQRTEEVKEVKEQEQRKVADLPAYDITELKPQETRPTSGFSGTIETRAEITQAIVQGKTNSKDLSPEAQKALQEYNAKREESLPIIEEAAKPKATPTNEVDNSLTDNKPAPEPENKATEFDGSIDITQPDFAQEVGSMASPTQYSDLVPLMPLAPLPAYDPEFGYPLSIEGDLIKFNSVEAITETRIDVSDDAARIDFGGKDLDPKYETTMENLASQRAVEILEAEHPGLLDEREARLLEQEKTGERKPAPFEELDAMMAAAKRATDEIKAEAKKTQTEQIAEFEKSPEDLKQAAANAPEELKGTLSQLAEEKAQAEQAATVESEEQAAEEPKSEVKEMASLDKPKPPSADIQATANEGTKAPSQTIPSL